MRSLGFGGTAILIMAVALPATACAQEVSFLTAASFRVGGTPVAVALGRFGHDEHLDAVVTNFPRFGDNDVGTITVLHGTGTGTFTDLGDIPSADLPLYIAPGDYDGDKVLDLVLSEQESDFIYFHRGTADGTFEPPVRSTSGHDPAGVVGADVNDDGTLDIIQTLAAESGGRVNTLIGRGNGTFDLAAGSGRRLAAPSYALAVGYFNADTFLDVAAVALDDQLSILLGDGMGGLSVPTKFPTGDQPFSVAVDDLNQDGHSDIVVANGTDDTLSLYRGDGNAGFQRVGPFPVGAGPASLVLADIDGDGWTDAVTANGVSGDLSVAKGQRDGTFGHVRNFVGGLRPQAVAVGDLNGDGRPDLVAVNQGFDSPSGSVLLANPRGFDAIESLLGVGHADAVAIGDLNGDGLPDLTVSAATGRAIMIFRADPTGGFSAGVSLPTGVNTNAMWLADVNRDGRPDILAAGADSAEVLVMLAQPDGSFAAATHVAVAGVPSGFAIADFDRDGNLDVAAASKSPPAVSVLFGDGAGLFPSLASVTLTGSPISCAVGDFDDNGIVDLAVGNSEADDVSLLLSHGDRTFDASKTVAVGHLPSDLAAADLDGDGHDDLALISDNAVVLTFYGKGDGTFDSGPGVTAGGLLFGLAIRDVTGDLQPDLLVASRISNSVSVIRNAGGRSLAQSVDFVPGLAPTLVTSADFDGDGRYDIAAGGSGAWVLTNAAGAQTQRGDGNDDGRITSADLTALQRGRASGSRVEDVRRDAAVLGVGVDANGDGGLDAFDATLTLARIFRTT